MNTKRLFCYSIYSRSGEVDDYVLYYLKALCNCGDVLVYADNDKYKESLKKIKKLHPNIKYAGACKHGEYDFGSYKRCVQWAKLNNIIDNYDYIYICNDSVIGPLCDLNTLLIDLENEDKDFISLYYYDVTGLEGPQSWFIGFNKILHKTIVNFLLTVEKQQHKDDVVMQYEHGLGKVLEGYTSTKLVHMNGLDNFFDPESFFNKYPNYPFLKKRSLYYINKARINDFINNLIKDTDLAKSIINLLPSIMEHEKTMKPKNGVQYGSLPLTDHKVSFLFKIPPVDPKKKKEQKYF